MTVHLLTAGLPFTPQPETVSRTFLLLRGSFLCLPVARTATTMFCAPRRATFCHTLVVSSMPVDAN